MNDLIVYCVVLVFGISLGAGSMYALYVSRATNRSEITQIAGFVSQILSILIATVSLFISSSSGNQQAQQHLRETTREYLNTQLTSDIKKTLDSLNESIDMIVSYENMDMLNRMPKDRLDNVRIELAKKLQKATDPVVIDYFSNITRCIDEKTCDAEMAYKEICKNISDYASLAEDLDDSGQLYKFLSPVTENTGDIDLSPFRIRKTPSIIYQRFSRFWSHCRPSSSSN